MVLLIRVRSMSVCSFVDILANADVVKASAIRMTVNILYKLRSPITDGACNKANEECDNVCGDNC